MGHTLDSIHDSNFSTVSRCPLPELIAKTLDLSLRLRRCRDNELEGSQIINSDVSFASWSNDTFQAKRDSILISIFYYRTVLLVHGSLLTSALEAATMESQELASVLVRDTIRSLLKEDLAAVTNLHHLIRGLLVHQRSFFNRNAVWWICNYAGKIR